MPDPENYAVDVSSYLPGYLNGTIGYSSDGLINVGDNFPIRAKEYEVGDIIGCAFDFNNNEYIFTRNGKRIYGSTFIVMAAGYYYPCIGFTNNDTIVDTNLGESPFLFNSNNVNILNTKIEYLLEKQSEEDIIKRYTPLIHFLCNSYRMKAYDVLKDLHSYYYEEADDIIMRIEKCIDKLEETFSNSLSIDCDDIYVLSDEYDNITYDFAYNFVYKYKYEILADLMKLKKPIYYTMMSFRFYSHKTDLPDVGIVVPITSCLSNVFRPDSVSEGIKKACIMSMVPQTNNVLLVTNTIQTLLDIVNNGYLGNSTIEDIVMVIYSLLYYEENDLIHVKKCSIQLFNFIIEHEDELLNINNHNLFEYTIYILSRIIIINNQIDYKDIVTKIGNIIYKNVDSVSKLSKEYYSFILCYSLDSFDFNDKIDPIFINIFHYFISTTNQYMILQVIHSLFRFCKCPKRCSILHNSFDNINIISELLDVIDILFCSNNKTALFYFSLLLKNFVPHILYSELLYPKLIEKVCRLFENTSEVFQIINHCAISILSNLLNTPNLYNYIVNSNKVNSIINSILTESKMLIPEVKNDV